MAKAQLKLTIEDVARAAGVSRSTVSRVMNNLPGVNEAVRREVKRIITDLAYVPDQTARALASRQHPAIDVVAVTHGSALGWLGSHPYYSRVLAGVMTVLDGRDVQLRVHSVGDDDAAVDAIAERATAGIVLADAPPGLAARLRRRCKRVVSLVATANSVPTVEADNAGGAYAAVTFLHGLGRRRIAAIHGPDDTSCGVNRRAGYLRAIEELGLPDLSDGGRFRREVGFDAAHRLLDRYPDLDAMFVACDLMAAGAVQAISATGRGVPHDVSVIGFDDSIAAVCANPPLTTMRMPVEEMAATATRLLLDDSVAGGYRQRFPVELVVRGST
ncbi:LacI family DNA-binding transcriptional regulator [Actinoplanes sp. L3-i22]|uniref:LacI family DNA-binding transcriptional regulator n=1 Tax=Actinoplanes sp. L3-i22 TaxID=2836373 RepID=UPI001C77E0E8|nr:LacI family DNA-binding transcriptional regulator [Actinoplanes sp. L3-i22]BCY11726.1 LacI family transcriptional regulator [Actinoplanes sp. L3-i22]